MELLIYAMYSLGEYSIAQSIPLIPLLGCSIHVGGSIAMLLTVCSASAVGVLVLLYMYSGTIGGGQDTGLHMTSSRCMLKLHL